MPGIDWRAVEARNLRDERARRNRLGRGLGKSTPGSGLWSEVGSRNLSGRMLFAGPGLDGSRLLGGAHLGGLWVSDPQGNGWSPRSDNLGGGIEYVVPLPPSVTGGPEGWVVLSGSGISAGPSGGQPSTVHGSHDGGLTWFESTGLGGVQDLRRMQSFQDGPRTVLLLVRKQVSGGQTRSVLLASVDGGLSFAPRWQGPIDELGDLWVPRTGPGAQGTAYLLSQGRLLESVDGAQTFQPKLTFDPQSTAGRLVGSEAGAFYALLSGGGFRLHASYDGGQTSQLVNSNAPGNGDTLSASVTDPLMLLHGGVEAFRSRDGGASFQIVNPWTAYYNDPLTKLHADIMGTFAWPDPSSPTGDVHYACTDGGIYASRDHGMSWANLSLAGLGVSEYYGIHTAENDPNLIAAGSQDQGHQYAVVAAPTGSGPSTDFTQLLSGDYGSVTSSHPDHDVVYSSYLTFMLIQIGASGPGVQYATAGHPGGSLALFPPMLADPLDPDRVYLGGSRLHRYDRIAPMVWFRSLHSTQVFESNGYISALAVAPSDPARMLAVTNQGRIFASQDHGVSWLNQGTWAPGTSTAYGKGAAIHPSDPQERVVAGSGYGMPGVIRSVDGGATWTPLVQGYPQTLTHGIAYAEDGSGDLFAANEAGPWHWRRADGIWRPIAGLGAPLVSYTDVEALGPGRVRFATYGRGIWDYRVPVHGSSEPFGVGKSTSAGPEFRLEGRGTPSLSGAGFGLQVMDGPAGAPGWLISADAGAGIPFQGATLYLHPPLRREQPFVLDSLGQALLPLALHPLDVGLLKPYQAWCRDPSHPDGTGSSLSNGVWVRFGG